MSSLVALDTNVLRIELHSKCLVAKLRLVKGYFEVRGIQKGCDCAVLRYLGDGRAGEQPDNLSVLASLANGCVRATQMATDRANSHEVRRSAIAEFLVKSGGVNKAVATAQWRSVKQSRI